MSLSNFKLNSVPILFEQFDPDKPLSADISLMSSVDSFALQTHELTGLCNISGVSTKFIIEHDNLRETVRSTVSGSYNRQRQLVCALSFSLFGHPLATLEEIAAVVNNNNLRLYTTEANGVLFEHLKRHIRADLFFSSEYLGERYQSGVIVHGVRHEDLQRSSFQDESFDIILSAEIFEHIPDALAAEREVIRLLKPGGIYCFTVPINLDAEHDDIRAEITDDGSIIYHTTPEYHGDPVRPDEGILVYRIFSHRDLLTRFTAAGCTFSTYRLWSRLLGILGQNSVVHIVTKPPQRTFALEAPSKIAQADDATTILKHNNDWLAAHLADLVEYFKTHELHPEYVKYWQSRGFHLTFIK